MDFKVSKYYHQKRFKLLLSAILVGVTLLLSNVNILDDIENRLLDYRFQHWGGDIQADSNIVIISIDNGSLDFFAENGVSWPWPRSFYGHMLDYLTSAEAKAVVFDMLFSHADADRSDTDAEETDGSFAQALNSNGKTVLGASILQPELHGFKPVDRAHMKLYEYADNSLTDSLLELPIPVLFESTSRIGHTNIRPDRDGIFRSVKPFVNHDGYALPSLAISAYMIAEDYSFGSPKSDGSNSLVNLPVNDAGDYLINWYGGAGPKGVFQYIPFSAVIQSASAVQYGSTPVIPISTFKNKMVIIGAGASGLHDLKATPILTNGMHPGMEVWATVLSNLTQQHFITLFPNSVLLILLLGMGFVVLMAFDRLKPRFAFLILIGQLLLFLILVYLMWIGSNRVLIPVLPAVLVSLLSYLLVFSNEMRERIFLKRVFGPYIAPELMQMMYETREAPSLGGEQVSGSAFFSDLQGFTKFSEKLTPVKLVALLNEYLTVMTDALMDLRGTLDKYEGDAIIAFFGAPVSDPEHAHQAVKAAIAMQTGLANLRLKWESEGDDWPPEIKHLQMRIGINSGEMLVGNVGSKGRMNFTMMGDTVNVAARLESSAKQYGVLTQISENTARQLPSEILLRRLGATRLVGKSQAAVTYEVLGYAHELDENDHELLRIWPKALEALTERDWDKAEKYFERTLALERKYDGRPTNPSKVYLRTRIPVWRDENPGEDWEAVWVFDSK